MSDRGERPFVSVVVISKDRHELLERSVNSLLKTNYPAGRREVIVVEEGDSPRPIEGARYVFLPRRNLGLGYARNRGASEASGEIIAFTDDDTSVDPEWLNGMTAPFLDGEVFGVAGLTRAQRSNLLGDTEEIIGLPGGGIGWLLKSADKPVETTLLSGCNCAYRREVFDKKRFKEDTFGRLGGDDWYMAKQVCAEHKCIFNPAAVLYHKPRASFSGLARTFYRRELHAYLGARELEKKGRLRYLAAKGTDLVLGRVILLGLTALTAGPFWVLLICALYYPAVLLNYCRLLPYVRRKAAYFLVPLTTVIRQLGVLRAELEILLLPEVRYGNVLDKY